MENQEVKNAKTLLQLLVKLSTSGVVQAPSKFVEKRLRVCAWANLPAMQHSKYIVSTWCLVCINLKQVGYKAASLRQGSLTG